MFRLKRWIKTGLFLGLLSVLTITACGPSGQVKQKKQSKPSPKVTFRKGTVIEIGFGALKKGKGKQLGLYFKKMIPVTHEYGSKFLAFFNVAAVPYGDKRPHMLGISEWPSIRANLRFQKDPRHLKARKIRDGALSYFSIGHFFKVKKDVTVTFRGNKMYELWAVWVKQKGGKNIKKYFKEVNRIAKRHGGKKLVVFYPLKLKRSTRKKIQAARRNPDDFTPDIVGLVEWPGPSAYKSFRSDRKYRKVMKLRKKAIKRFETFHGMLPPPKK